MGDANSEASATLTVAGVLTNAATINVAGGSGNTPSAKGAPGSVLLVAAGGTLANSGAVDVSGGDGPASFEDAGAVTNAGTIVVGGGGAFNIGDSGPFQGSSGATMSISGDLTNSGLVDIQQGANVPGGVNLSGTLTVSGCMYNHGSIDLESAINGGVVLSVGADALVDNMANATGFFAGDAATIEIAGVLTNASTLALSGGGIQSSVRAAGISLDRGAVLIVASGGSLTNAGLIEGDGSATGFIQGYPSGTYYAGYGAAMTVAGVAVNTGQIALGGSAGHAFTTKSGLNGAGRLTVLPGGTLIDNGLITLGAAPVVDNPASLEPTYGATLVDNGVITGSGALRNLGVVQSAASASVTIGLATVLNDGRVTVGANGELTFSHRLWDDWQADHALVGTVALSSDSTLVLAAEVATHQTLLFGTGRGTLVFDDAAGMHGLISGFATGDDIDLASVVGNHASFSQGVLHLAGGTQEIASLRLAGSYTSASFVLHADGHGGTVVTVSASA